MTRRAVRSRPRTAVEMLLIRAVGRKRRARPEQALQQAVVKFLTLALDPAVIWFHPANEQAGELARKIGKGMGVKPGTPDLIFLWYEGHAAIELKVPGKDLSVAQSNWRDAYEKTGGLYAVCRSVEQVEGIMRVWKLPLRGTTRAKR